MKILTTALFSVLLLRKRLSSTKWLSLFLLAVGVAIVQLQSGGSTRISTHSSMEPLKGLGAVTAACFTSGLAGVYFERVLKNSPGDLWVRNVQLSLFSLLPALGPLAAAGELRGGMAATHLFSHFTPAAWATIAVQVLGGLITALVIKYSDNICKGFATSLSIVLSALASVALFDFHMSVTFVAGASIVLAATMLYAQPDSGSWTDGRRWAFGSARRVALPSPSFAFARAGAVLMASMPGSPIEEKLPMLAFLDREKAEHVDGKRDNATISVGRNLHAVSAALRVGSPALRSSSSGGNTPEAVEVPTTLSSSLLFSGATAQRALSRVQSQLPSRVHSPSPRST
jgi:solute carrier family 35 (UDP-sugar transporter), member A1/2/3